MYGTYVDGEKVFELEYDLEREIWGDYAQIGQGGKLTESYSGQLSQVS